LPLGLRTVEKIERIIDAEMQAIGSEKLSLPMLLNPEGWKKTGRWDGSKGEASGLNGMMRLCETHMDDTSSFVCKIEKNLIFCWHLHTKKKSHN